MQPRYPERFLELPPDATFQHQETSKVFDYIAADAKKAAIWALVALVAMFVLGVLTGIACAQESDPFDDLPVFSSHQEADYHIVSDTPDIAKLDARCVDIVRAQLPGITLAQARAKVRVKGKTDVRACVNVLIQHALRGIKQAQMRVVSSSNQDEQAIQPE